MIFEEEKIFQFLPLGHAQLRKAEQLDLVHIFHSVFPQLYIIAGFPLASLGNHIFIV